MNNCNILLHCCFLVAALVFAVEPAFFTNLMRSSRHATQDPNLITVMRIMTLSTEMLCVCL